jgi:CRP/FNR family transcriptional regulator, cyclic AMP receptor protein
MNHGFTEELLASVGRQRRFQKGVVFIQEQDPGDSMFLLLSGSVRAYSVSSDDKEIIYGVYGPGELFGEMALDGGLRSASLITLEKCDLIEVDLSAVRRLILLRPELALDLVNLVIRRARRTTEAARQMVLLDVYGRLRLYLDDTSHALEDGTRRLDRSVTQQEIARRIGSSREMISRLFKDLSAGGYLKEGADKHLLLLKRLPEKW